jgi:hypothetical protein
MRDTLNLLKFLHSQDTTTIEISPNTIFVTETGAKFLYMSSELNLPSRARRTVPPPGHQQSPFFSLAAALYSAATHSTQPTSPHRGYPGYEATRAFLFPVPSPYSPKFIAAVSDLTAPVSLSILALY